MKTSNHSLDYEHMLKLLIIGDSGVGKSSLLLRYMSNSFEALHPTIGVDFKVKHVSLAGKKLKLVVWDTAGQERFRSLPAAYYRGAHGIFMAYDITRRETFNSLSERWTEEIDLHSTNQDCVKVLVGNKIDRENDRVVSTREGVDFARENDCLFFECSAVNGFNVEACFEHQILKILETPSFLNIEQPNNLPVVLHGYNYSNSIPVPDENQSWCCKW